MGRISARTIGLLIVSIVIVGSIAAFAAYYPTLLANSTSTAPEDEQPNKQLDVAIAYAYAGPSLSDTSINGDNGANMYAVTQYPSAVILNITLLGGNTFSTCDAFIEIYRIQVKTDTNQTENYFYTMGTNFKPSFSPSEYVSLSRNVVNFTVKQSSIGTIGGFKFNMTENCSVLSLPIGSSGAYASMPSGDGLWQRGTPNTITVTAQRIGVLTISNGAVTALEDDVDTAPKTSVNLNPFGTGFLYNQIVPASTLESIDLFHPIQNSPNK
jgi:hypothetical protein